MAKASVDRCNWIEKGPRKDFMHHFSGVTEGRHSKWILAFSCLIAPLAPWLLTANATYSESQLGKEYIHNRKKAPCRSQNTITTVIG